MDGVWQALPMASEVCNAVYEISLRESFLV